MSISQDTQSSILHTWSWVTGDQWSERAISDVSPADLQGFLSPVLQLAPGQMSTKNFCAVLQPGPWVTAASKANAVHKRSQILTVEESEEALLHSGIPALSSSEDGCGESTGLGPHRTVLGLSQLSFQGNF